MVLAKVVGIVLALSFAACSVILFGSLFVDDPVIAGLAERARVVVLGILIPALSIYVVIMERRKMGTPNNHAVHEPPAT